MHKTKAYYFYTFLFLLFCITTQKSFGSMGGIGDWQDVTPFGNRMDNFTLYLKNKTTLSRPSKWYFYKGYIIGNGSEYKNASARFFIINDQNCVIELFKNEEEWHAAILEKDLKPTIWTRWYRYEWHFFHETLLMAIIVGFPFYLPILLGILFLVYWVMVIDKFSLTKKSTKVFAGFCLLVFIRYLLDLYPSSF